MQKAVGFCHICCKQNSNLIKKEELRLPNLLKWESSSVRRDSAGLAETWRKFLKFQRMSWELPQLVVQNTRFPEPGSDD
eukprot:6176825-Pleurochrysis_carterae.AAC.1